MSLDSAGVSIEIADVSDVVRTGRKKLGRGFSREGDAADALRQAIEDFIISAQFKQFTESSRHNSIDVRMEFLLHTVMPR